MNDDEHGDIDGHTVEMGGLKVPAHDCPACDGDRVLAEPQNCAYHNEESENGR